MTFVKDGLVHYVLDILLVPFREEQHRFGISFWGFAQTFSGWIFAEAFEDGSHGAGEFVEPDFCLVGGLFKSFSSSST